MLSYDLLNIKFQSNIFNSSRDIEGNVNFGHFLSLKRGITLVNMSGDTSFFGAHNSKFGINILNGVRGVGRTSKKSHF